MKRKSELREKVIMYNSIFSSVNLPCKTNCVRARKRIPLTYFKITFQKSVEGHVAHWKKKIINDMVITSSLVTTKTDFCNPPYSIGKKNTPVEPASWLKMLESRKDLSQQTCDQRFQPTVTQTTRRRHADVFPAVTGWFGAAAPVTAGNTSASAGKIRKLPQ